MKKLLRLGVLLAAGSLALQDVTIGHGGTYRGPGDTVPPGGAGGGSGAGPLTPGPVGPRPVPGPGPTTPGVGGTGGPAPGPHVGGADTITVGGGAASTDLSSWQFWWGFNKERYLHLREAIRSGSVRTGTDDFFIGRGLKVFARDSLGPNEDTIRDVIVPALLEALAKERQNDIVTGALVALAKIGDAKDERGESRFQQVIQGFLRDKNQEIAETAAIALGILANDASIELLTSLMRDEPEGREAVGSTSVNYRTRAFAAYGLGLIGNRTEDNATCREIVQSLIEVLQLPRQATRDLKVAALTSLGIVPIDPGTAPQAAGDGGEVSAGDAAYHASTRETQVRFLLALFQDERNEHDFVRAHAPRALALLAPADGKALRTEIVDALVRALDPHSKERNEVLQSAVLALGQLGDCDADPHDRRLRDVLRKRIAAGGDEQCKRFAVIALAQVGGRPGTNQPDAGYADIKQELITDLARTGGGMSRLKPWLGLALGVLQAGRTEATGTGPDPDVARALRTALVDSKRPMDVGAYCLGAGIAKDQEAKEIVLAQLDRFADDEARGYAAVALGLMGARDAIVPIKQVVQESKYRSELLKQAAIALGLLGDKQLVDELVKMLEDARGLASQAAISSALGFIGDAQSVNPLVEMLRNPSLTASARGFAAVALGIVADKEPMPWNAKLSIDINYRANTTTLTGENGTGILDIL